MLQMIVAIQALAGRLTDRVSDDEQGATMVEYGLMVALIAVVVALAVGPLGDAIANLFTEVEGQL